jgi:cell division protein FtsI/penicillin-binding protein 2/cell division protein FtsW (lipid II flippase)
VAPRPPPLAGVDPLLVLSLTSLGVLGVLNLMSLGETPLAVHQATTVALGLTAMVVVARRRSRTLRIVGRGIYATALLLLMAVAVAGSHAGGATRWLDVGSVVFQPSELGKLGLLLVLADILGRRPPLPHRLLVAVAFAAPPIGLTLLEPDLSTSLLLALLAGFLVLLARVRLRSIAALAAGIALLIPAGLRLLRPYQVARLQQFLGGAQGAGGEGWTRLQAHIAVASGGTLGSLSLVPTSLLAQYLPARDTDLAFASLIEQRGILLGAAALAAAAVAVWRLVAGARRTRTDVGALIATGFAALLGAEVVINVAGNLGVLPFAGVPFPLLSFGGSAVIAHFVAAGAVMGERREEFRRRLWCPPMWARPRRRLAAVIALGIAAALVGLAAVTLDIQRTEGPTLRRAGLIQATRTVVIPGARGAIEDRHGIALAVDAPVARVLAIPGVVTKRPGAVARLAALLGERLDAVDAALRAPPPHGGFAAVVATSVPMQTADAVTKAGLPGVIVVPQVQRRYPYGSSLAPVLGFVGVATADDVEATGPLSPDEVVGRAGLERRYDSVLRGADGTQHLLVDPTGYAVAMGRSTPPRAGGDLRLSIDLGLQQAATAFLDTALRGVPGQPRGDEGSIVVMDARSGEILAMASQPAYDDNAYGPPVNEFMLRPYLHATGDPFLEHATQTVMPPGSTYKEVVAAADLATGAVPPTLVIATGASFHYDGMTFDNWTALPSQNLVQAVAWSNDVYFYKLALALGADRIAQVASQLGVGQSTGIDLPGEVAGFLGTPDNVGQLGDTWYAGSTVIEGIGQGYLDVTPLQDARWTAAVGTGVLVTPHLALSQRPAGAIAFARTPTPAPAPLPFAAALGPLQAGLRLAVTSGTGTLLRSLPQPAAGKTGTAQDPSAPDGGPDAWYTAYSPASAPQVVVTVSVRGGGEGASTAEPAARDVLAYFDAHEAQIMATASAQPPPASSWPAAGNPVSAASVAGVAAPGLASAAALEPIWIQRRRRRPAATVLRRLPRRRRSVGASSAGWRSQRPPPDDAQTPRASSHRQTPGPRPA